MWFIVVRVWFILEYHRGHFPSCWHHAIGRKWGHPEVLAQLEVIGVCLSSEHLGLFWPYLPHPNSKLCTIFFHGLLILQVKFYQNFIIFLNLLDRSPKFQFRQNAWEQVRIRITWACFGHISLIRTRNCTPFFSWTPYSSGKILSKFHNFSQSARPVPKVSV